MSTRSPASAGPAPAPAPTIEEMEAALVARRERLAVDMEVLGTRLAPEALKTQARDTARTTAAWTRSTARIVADRAGAAARDAVDRPYRRVPNHLAASSFFLSCFSSPSCSLWSVF